MSEFELYEKNLEKFWENCGLIFRSREREIADSYREELNKRYELEIAPIRMEILVSEILNLISSTPYEWICTLDSTNIQYESNETFLKIQTTNSEVIVYGGPWFIDRWINLLISLRLRLAKVYLEYKNAAKLHKLLLELQIKSKHNFGWLMETIQSYQETIKYQNEIKIVQLHEWKMEDFETVSKEINYMNKILLDYDKEIDKLLE